MPNILTTVFAHFLACGGESCTHTLYIVIARQLVAVAIPKTEVTRLDYHVAIASRNDTVDGLRIAV